MRVQAEQMTVCMLKSLLLYASSSFKSHILRMEGRVQQQTATPCPPAPLVPSLLLDGRPVTSSRTQSHIDGSWSASSSHRHPPPHHHHHYHPPHPRHSPAPAVISRRSRLYCCWRSLWSRPPCRMEGEGGRGGGVTKWRAFPKLRSQPAREEE